MGKALGLLQGRACVRRVEGAGAVLWCVRTWGQKLEVLCARKCPCREEVRECCAGGHTSGHVGCLALRRLDHRAPALVCLLPQRADMVIEAVIEDIPLKQRIFAGRCSSCLLPD